MEPDIKANEERLFELYLAWCQQHKTKAALSDFSVWKDEQGYADDLDDLYV